ncbi:Protein kinase domain [Carpediemonas membranifera]|uniref:Protein kinase domain n=1 Tax=Carpediemonas membranifera TaxID=201153 RepID=A0A8J6BDF7_9EUKA|nr:Protein kinase domain [Carpediemonas membranifera]|eukprot:KAG9395187.1 Protein kinase domain [Carpediemonas membranifera]
MADSSVNSHEVDQDTAIMREASDIKAKYNALLEDKALLHGKLHCFTWIQEQCIASGCKDLPTRPYDDDDQSINAHDDQPICDVIVSPNTTEPSPDQITQSDTVSAEALRQQKCRLGLAVDRIINDTIAAENSAAAKDIAKIEETLRSCPLAVSISQRFLEAQPNPTPYTAEKPPPISTALGKFSAINGKLRRMRFFHQGMLDGFNAVGDPVAGTAVTLAHKPPVKIQRRPKGEAKSSVEKKKQTTSRKHATRDENAGLQKEIATVFASIMAGKEAAGSQVTPTAGSVTPQDPPLRHPVGQPADTAIQTAPGPVRRKASPVAWPAEEPELDPATQLPFLPPVFSPFRSSFSPIPTSGVVPMSLTRNSRGLFRDTKNGVVTYNAASQYALERLIEGALTVLSCCNRRDIADLVATVKYQLYLVRTQPGRVNLLALTNFTVHCARLTVSESLGFASVWLRSSSLLVSLPVAAAGYFLAPGSSGPAPSLPVTVTGLAIDLAGTAAITMLFPGVGFGAVVARAAGFVLARQTAGLGASFVSWCIRKLVGSRVSATLIDDFNRLIGKYDLKFTQADGTKRPYRYTDVATPRCKRKLRKEAIEAAKSKLDTDMKRQNFKLHPDKNEGNPIPWDEMLHDIEKMVCLINNIANRERGLISLDELMSIVKEKVSSVVDQVFKGGKSDTTSPCLLLEDKTGPALPDAFKSWLEADKSLNDDQRLLCLAAAEYDHTATLCEWFCLAESEASADIVIAQAYGITDGQTVAEYITRCLEKADHETLTRVAARVGYDGVANVKVLRASLKMIDFSGISVFDQCDMLDALGSKQTSPLVFVTRDTEVKQPFVRKKDEGMETSLYPFAPLTEDLQMEERTVISSDGSVYTSNAAAFVKFVERLTGLNCTKHVAEFVLHYASGLDADHDIAVKRVMRLCDKGDLECRWVGQLGKILKDALVASLSHPLDAAQFDLHSRFSLDNACYRDNRGSFDSAVHALYYMDPLLFSHDAKTLRAKATTILGKSNPPVDLTETGCSNEKLLETFKGKNNINLPALWAIQLYLSGRVRSETVGQFELIQYASVLDDRGVHRSIERFHLELNDSQLVLRCSYVVSRAGWSACSEGVGFTNSHFFNVYPATVDTPPSLIIPAIVSSSNVVVRGTFHRSLLIAAHTLANDVAAKVDDSIAPMLAQAYRAEFDAHIIQGSHVEMTYGIAGLRSMLKSLKTLRGEAQRYVDRARLRLRTIIPRDDIDDFERDNEHCIGRGSHASVFRGTYFVDGDMENAVPVAIKFIDNVSGAALEATLAEISRHMLLSGHANVVTLYGVLVDENQQSLGLVMERCNNTLRAVIHGNNNNNDVSFSADEKRSVLRQVAAGMAHCHTKGVIHRDVKPSNVLVKRTGRGLCGLEGMVSDFGISVNAAARATTTGAVHAGTLVYSAPETFDNVFSEKTDVYAFGILAWELLTGRQPWEEAMSPAAIMCKIYMQHQTPDMSLIPDADLRALVEQCVQPLPESRPGFSEVAAQWAL